MPYYALQWLASVSSFNKPIQTWLLDNMSTWVKPLLIGHKQTNVRFSAANLLANLVPNRLFRDSFNSNRNMLVPFKPLLAATSNNNNNNNNRCNEINLDFDSMECKEVLHKIIMFLFSLIDHLEQYVQPAAAVAGESTTPKQQVKDSNDSSQLNNTTNSTKITVTNTTTNHLVQYFTVLIYFMCGKEEKQLFTSYNQTCDKFWSLIYYPHIANNHVFTNLNKQVAVHFFYQTLLNCAENLAYILACTNNNNNNKNDENISTDIHPTTSSNIMHQNNKTSKLMFTNRIARELPMCTVAVDHEDGDLISYNRQCLHPYYASIRLLCQYSPVYTREMSTHSNFYWAFKHIMPYCNLYPNAVQELNKIS